MFLLSRYTQYTALAMNPAETPSDHIGFAAIEALAPAASAFTRSSSPNTKAKLSIDENNPEKMQIISPSVNPDRGVLDWPELRSRWRPAIVRQASPMVMITVPMM